MFLPTSLILGFCFVSINYFYEYISYLKILAVYSVKYCSQWKSRLRQMAHKCQPQVYRCVIGTQSLKHLNLKCGMPCYKSSLIQITLASHFYR